MEKKFSRQCPVCRQILFHTNKKNRNMAVKQGAVCRDCFHIRRLAILASKPKETVFTRQCPECRKVLFHRTKESRNSLGLARAGTPATSVVGWSEACRN